MNQMDIFEVKLTEQAKKDLKKAPQYIIVKLLAWVDDVSIRGLREVRKTPGYHDEPLKGKRMGQRSIRLSKSYRAIYIIDNLINSVFIKIIEVNKHEY